MLLWRFLGLGSATAPERRATFWLAVMFFACLASTFLVRPLRSQFGVDQGVGRMPYLYSLTLLATVGLVVPFWWLADRMPSRRFVPIALHACTAGMLALAFGLSAVGDYDWKSHAWIGDVFWGGFSAVNVAVPALVWIHAVEHFGKGQAKRLFGLIAVGGTLGAVAGSYGAKLLSKDVPLWGVGVGAALLLQLAWLAFRRSSPHCAQLEGGNTRRAFAPGGLLEGLRIVARDRRALGIAVYLMLVGFVATAFEAAQTELVGGEIDRAWRQQSWLADVGLYGNLLVLFLQFFCTGRLMPRWSGAAMLASLPLLSMAGLGVYWFAPTAVMIFGVQIVRRGAQYAFEKPAREVLFTPLDLATKHKVKFLVDTFALRLGDLCGAVAQVGLREAGFGVGAIVAITLVFAFGWVLLARGLGRDQRPARSTS